MRFHFDSRVAVAMVGSGDCWRARLKEGDNGCLCGVEHVPVAWDGSCGSGCFVESSVGDVGGKGTVRGALPVGVVSGWC